MCVSLLSPLTNRYQPLCTLVGVKKKSIRLKLVENLWYVCYYPTLSLIAWYLLSGASFFPWNSVGFWNEFPNFGDWTAHPSWYYYYALQLGFYLQGLVALVSFETKRKDFTELMLHHVVTILLIVLSYCASHHRLGLNVLIVHDLSDVLLYLAKVMHYMDKYGRVLRKIFNALTQIIFISFALLFAWSRNYVFPNFIILPSVICGEVFSFIGYREAYVLAHCGVPHCENLAVRTLGGALVAASPGYLGSMLAPQHYAYDPSRSHFLEISHLGMCLGPYCFHSGVVLIWLMILLELLHVFWLFMIIRMIIHGLREKEVKQDIRSESEDESEWNGEDSKSENEMKKAKMD